METNARWWLLVLRYVLIVSKLVVIVFFEKAMTIG